jgi:hypothetical protein
MTLNITVAAPWLVCQCSDLRLTYPNGTIADDASPKVVQASAIRGRWQVLVGYAGTSELEGSTVHEWVARLVKQHGSGSVDALVETVREAATRAVKRTSSQDPRQSFAVAATSGERALAFLISNFQELSGPDHHPPTEALYSRHLQGGVPRVLVIGSGAKLVTPEEIRVLRRLVKGRIAPPEILNYMAAINARVAKIERTVSEACIAAVLLPDGSSWTVTFGDVRTAFVPSRIMDGIDLGKMFLDALNAGKLHETPPLASCERFTLEGRWTPIADMSSPRTGHSSTRLSDGRLLVVGGSDGGESLSTVEVFDPASGRWSPAMPMLDRRRDHCAVLLPDTKVMVVGGAEGDLQACELYDPSVDTWTSTGRLSGPRKNIVIVPLSDGRVLAIGGTGPKSNALSSVELYDPAVGIWQPQADLREQRYAFAAGALSGQSVLVVGGNNGALVNASIRSCELLAAPGAAWRSVSSLAKARWRHRATPLPNGDLLVVGGISEPSCEIYCAASDTWRTTSPMIVSRTMPCHLTLMADGGVLVCGGQGSGNGPCLADTERFDPSTGAWSSCAPMIVPRTDHAASLLDDGSVLVTGGTGEGAIRRSPAGIRFVQGASIQPR